MRLHLGQFMPLRRRLASEPESDELRKSTTEPAACGLLSMPVSRILFELLHAAQTGASHSLAMQCTAPVPVPPQAQF